MPWTESRTRDEWLAEVRRRGERLRRRRQMTIAIVGALAMVLPVSAAAGYLTADRDGPQQLSVAGPAPAGPAAGTGAARPAEMAPGPGVAPAGEPDPAVEPGTPTTLPGPSVENISRRTEPVGPLGGGGVTVGPLEPVPPADDPVVRPTTTVAPPLNVGSPPPAQSQSTSRSAGAGVSTVAVAPCPAEALQLDVVPTKATFSRGETVSGMFFLQTRQASDCLVYLPSSFRIEEVATGKVLATVASTSEFPSPARAEVGRMPTSTFTWDQMDCASEACTQVGPGLYQAVAVWSDGRPYRAWGEFRIGG